MSFIGVCDSFRVALAIEQTLAKISSVIDSFKRDIEKKTDTEEGLESEDEEGLDDASLALVRKKKLVQNALLHVYTAAIATLERRVMDGHHDVIKTSASFLQRLHDHCDERHEIMDLAYNNSLDSFESRYIQPNVAFLFKMKDYVKAQRDAIKSYMNTCLVLPVWNDE